MRASTLLAILLILTVRPATAQEMSQEADDADANPEWQEIQKLQADVTRAAFNPEWYFTDKYAEPDIQIRHIGSMNDPIWAMRLARGSLKDASDGHNWRARVIMAPGLEEEERARDAGMALIGRAQAYRKKHPQSDISDLLDHLGLDWFEIDTRSCPALKEGLHRAADIKWLLPYLQPPPDKNFVVVAITHSDQVGVKFRNEGLFWHAEYWGQVEEGNPAHWAIELRKSLKSCWKPAAAPPPWRNITQGGTEGKNPEN